MCSLHCKYMAKGRIDARFSLSRERCISSALALLELQAPVLEYASSRPSKSMITWYTVPQIMHFFITAVMTVCLELEYRRRAEDWGGGAECEVLLGALEKSCALWKGVQDCSEEAGSVYRVLRAMLRNFGSEHGCESPAQAEGSGSQIPGMDRGLQNSSEEFAFGNDIDAFGDPNEIDLDWSLTKATWDSFIEGTSFEDAYQAALFNDTPGQS